MAIKISGCTVIDDSRNITNANNMCVGVVTMTGSTGDIETPGTITAGELDFPPGAISFSPSDGATDVQPDTDIVITFNQFVQKQTTGIGTTANITLRNSSGIGTVIETISVASTNVTTNGSVVTITPVNDYLPYNTDVYVVVDEDAFNSIGENFPLIDTYHFTTKELEPGDPYECGYLICEAASTRWVVAPNTAEVTRNWFCRNDANTRAQQVSGCTGWFVPSCGQLQNPGYTCRTHWDSYCAVNYWSNTQHSNVDAWMVNMDTGCAICSPSSPAFVDKTIPLCVRAFRCVSY